jgi:hypothetical protein
LIVCLLIPFFQKKGVYARVAEMWAKDVSSTQNAGDKLAAAAVKLEELANRTSTVSPKKEILSQDQTVKAKGAHAILYITHKTKG